MSKKILSAVLAIAMVVSLCASLFTVSTSAATNYEADRAELKEAIKELFIKGPSVSDDTIEFLTKAEILTVHHNTTLEEIERNKVFAVKDPGTCGCGCNTNYISNDGKYDTSKGEYFVKADSELSTDIDELLQKAATAYYFGQNADELVVDASFNEGRNDIVKAQLKVVKDYIADLKKEIGAEEDKPADYKKVYADWKSTNAKYNPSFGINPYGDDYSNADWYQILQNYNGNFFGWISFTTIKADSAKADLLTAFERLYRAAQTAKVEGKLFYDFVLNEKAKLEDAWNKLIAAFKKEEFKWDLPAAGSVAAAIKEYNNMLKVIEFFNAYIVDTYSSVYAPADAKLLANVALANSVKEFVAKNSNTKEAPSMAMYIGVIGADYFKKVTNDLIASIAALNPEAANLAISNEDIDYAVALINEAQALYNAYSNKDVFTNATDASKGIYNKEYAALKAAIDAFKVLIPYDAESYASYKVTANSSAKIWDTNGTEVNANDALVITFAPSYLVYAKYMLALEDALADHIANINDYNAKLDGSLGKVEGDGSVAPGPDAGCTSADRADLANVLDTYDYLVGELISVKDGVATSDPDFKAIADKFMPEFIAAIVCEDHNPENFVADNAAVAQYNEFKIAFAAGLKGNQDGGVNFANLAKAIKDLIPYLTANLEEIINLYAYEAAVLASFFGIDDVVIGKISDVDYKNPANYLGYKAGTVKIAGEDKAVTLAELLAIIAKYVDVDGTLELVNGSAAIDNEMVKAIFAEINTVIAFYNEYVAGSYELPEIEITTQDIEDLITFYLENKDKVAEAIENVYAKVEAGIKAALETIIPNPTTATGYATVAYGLVKLYEGYTGEDIQVAELLKYVDLDADDILALYNNGITFDAIKAIAVDKIKEVIAGYKAKLEAIDTPEALYAALIAANDLIDWYNANVAGEYEIDEIELLPTDVYKVDASFDIHQIWEKLTAGVNGDIVIEGLVKPGVDTEIAVVAEGAYYDMMVNFFKLAALTSATNVDTDRYATKYETKVNVASLNEARKAFIESVKNLLTDDRGDELVDEFIADVYSWVTTTYVKETANTYELYEKLVEIFGEGEDCTALTLPTNAAEPYNYYIFNLKHIINHPFSSNKYSKDNGKFDKHILNPLKNKSESDKEYSVSEYDREWIAEFAAIRTTAGHLVNMLESDKIPDVSLTYVLGIIEQLDFVLDTQDEHHVSVLAAYKADVLDTAIAAATGKNAYDYLRDTDAGADVWAKYEKAYGDAVAAKYDTRMPKSEIDAIVETLYNALASLELVKKPTSAATVADLEAKIVAAEALVAKADDLDTAVKVQRLNELNAAIAAAKQAIVDLKYVTNYNTFDIEAQIAAIQTAMDNVVASQTFADDLVSYLTFILNAVQPYYTEYTEESFGALIAAWDAAQKVAADDSLKASAYVAAKAAVAAAYEALEYKPAPTMTKTYEAAVAKLAELKSVSTEGYTAESVAAFNAAVAALQAGINNVAADDALLELIANAYIAKASLAVVVENPITCD